MSAHEGQSFSTAPTAISSLAAGLPIIARLTNGRRGKVRVGPFPSPLARGASVHLVAHARKYCQKIAETELALPACSCAGLQKNLGPRPWKCSVWEERDRPGAPGQIVDELPNRMEGKIMLVLTRRIGEEIVIDGDIRVTVVD